MGIVAGPRIAIPSFLNQYSMDFDGVDDYIDLGDSDDFSFGNGTTDSPFSISTWIKIGQTTSQGIVTKYGSVNSTQEYLFYTTAGKLRLLLLDANNGENNFTTGITNLAIDTWYHVACTYDGRGGINARLGITLYINGNEETVTTSGGAYTAMSNTSQPVEIGKHLTSELLGNIDEIAIFNSELSASDITSIYNSGTPNDLTSLNPVAWYRMGDSAVFRDPQWLLPSNENKDKVSNYSMAFDGVNDVMVINNTLDITNGLTMSCWVKFATTVTSTNWLCSTGGTGGANGHFNTRLAANGVWVNYLSGGPFFVLGISAAELKDGNWHHIAQTIDYANAEMRFYQDGVESTSVRSIGLATTTVKINQIGGATTTPVYPFTGNIDEFAILEGAKSLAEIQEIYNSGVPIDLTSFSPLAWYKMGEDATFDGTNWAIPDVKGLAPGTTTNMDISDRVGDAPGSANNGLSVNMDRFDKVEDVPT